MTEIGGFQVATVDEIPEQVKKAKGIYADIVVAAEEAAPRALALNIGDDKKAATKVQGLRGHLKRHGREEEFVVARASSNIYIQLLAAPKAA